jgi:hypothetical protein
VHWEEQRKAMQADQYNKAELARCIQPSVKQASPISLLYLRARLLVELGRRQSTVWSLH